ncbi:MAG TPA: hypothetical protein EYP08_04695 [Pyrodictiaceae archaeon]|nr:hypothetical protein [Pyrodictiaceae archaeon]
MDVVSFYRELEELSQRHAKLVRRLELYMRRLKADPGDEELQERILLHLRRLRVLRNKLLRRLEEGIDFSDQSSAGIAAREGVEILSEYMVLGGLYLEKEILQNVLKFAKSKRGARLLETIVDDIRRDIEEVSRLEELLRQLYG